ncbi:MAG TPA: type II toxin-antitoxin system RelE/ParE family toxin [Thermomicrobiales bacterium]
MSAPSRSLVLTTEATADIANTLLYSANQWGMRQRDISAQRLSAAIDRLTRFPDLGRIRDDLPAGMHAHPVEQHVVYYRVDDQAVTIIRVLHGKMNAPAHLT